jgi:hypothetical protein
MVSESQIRPAESEDPLAVLLIIDQAPFAVVSAKT